MARYIKANPRVAAFLGLMRDRNTVTDGNYLLWQADMLAFGPLTQLSETLAQIGGIAAVKRLVGTSQKIGVIHLFRLLSFYLLHTVLRSDPEPRWGNPEDERSSGCCLKTNMKPLFLYG